MGILVLVYWGCRTRVSQSGHSTQIMADCKRILKLPACDSCRNVRVSESASRSADIRRMRRLALRNRKQNITNKVLHWVDPLYSKNYHK